MGRPTTVPGPSWLAGRLGCRPGADGQHPIQVLEPWLRSAGAGDRQLHGRALQRLGRARDRRCVRFARDNARHAAGFGLSNRPGLPVRPRSQRQVAARSALADPRRQPDRCPVFGHRLCQHRCRPDALLQQPDARRQDQRAVTGESTRDAAPPVARPAQQHRALVWPGHDQRPDRGRWRRLGLVRPHRWLPGHHHAHCLPAAARPVPVSAEQRSRWRVAQLDRRCAADPARPPAVRRANATHRRLARALVRPVGRVRPSADGRPSAGGQSGPGQPAAGRDADRPDRRCG